jgi:hypothetical protein
MIADWALIVSLTESQQHFWEELIGHAVLGGQSIDLPGEVVAADRAWISSHSADRG